MTELGDNDKVAIKQKIASNLHAALAGAAAAAHSSLMETREALSDELHDDLGSYSELREPFVALAEACKLQPDDPTSIQLLNCLDVGTRSRWPPLAACGPAEPKPTAENPGPTSHITPHKYNGDLTINSTSGFKSPVSLNTCFCYSAHHIPLIHSTWQ
ncbi:unnamed protein product [Pleuronectes platessa]|uniref:Uncharacterized protein n=1 Tax=Pleuronectes platessa TaxID=8262 RepID=A0A9N7TK99_PLEPL|nr:unnamed protein product [Pleuronectes platessa]